MFYVMATIIGIATSFVLVELSILDIQWIVFPVTASLLTGIIGASRDSHKE